MRVRKVSKTNILQEHYFDYNGLVDTNVLVDLLFNKNKFNSEILVISAFFSDEVVEKFLSVNKNTKTKFFFRLKPRDFIDKSASFKGLELLIAENKEVFFNPRLHSKLYLFDNSLLFSGSANFTKKGLGLVPSANIENLFASQVSENDLDFIQSIFKESSQLDELKLTMMKKMIDDFDDNDLKNNEIPEFWPRPFNEKIEGLLVTDFPNIYDSKIDLINSRPYQWLYKTSLDNENNEIYFGELTSLLHNELIEDPMPYRSTIKSLLEDFLIILKNTDTSDITFEVPNHSKKIFLKQKKKGN